MLNDNSHLDEIVQIVLIRFQLCCLGLSRGTSGEYPGTRHQQTEN